MVTIVAFGILHPRNGRHGPFDIQQVSNWSAECRALFTLATSEVENGEDPMVVAPQRSYPLASCTEKPSLASSASRQVVQHNEKPSSLSLKSRNREEEEDTKYILGSSGSLGADLQKAKPLGETCTCK